jgi:hypothetical protein
MIQPLRPHNDCECVCNEYFDTALNPSCGGSQVPSTKCPCPCSEDTLRYRRENLDWEVRPARQKGSSDMLRPALTIILAPLSCAPSRFVAIRASCTSTQYARVFSDGIVGLFLADLGDVRSDRRARRQCWQVIGAVDLLSLIGLPLWSKRLLWPGCEKESTRLGTHNFLFCRVWNKNFTGWYMCVLASSVL